MLNQWLARLWVGFILVSGCSAQNVPQAPTDQLIKGAFDITTEWQTIVLDKPLETLPHSQQFEVLLNVDQHMPSNDSGINEFDIISGSFKRIADDVILNPSVILVDDQGHEFRATVISVGFRKTKLGTYHFLGYGINPKKGKFYFPKEAKFVAVKVKANTAMKVEHFYWVASQYYQAPNDKWEDTPPSKILSLK